MLLLMKILALISFNVVSTSKIPFFLNSKSCLSKECHSLETTIKNSLNYSNQACTNFYKHTCDNWKSNKPKSEPIWNQYVALTYKINNNIQIILENPSNSHINAHTFYKSCISNEFNDKYLNEFKVFINKLGGWSILGDFKHKNYNPILQLVEITRLLNVHPILKIHVDVDFANTSKHSLYISPGDTIFPNVFLSEPKKYSQELHTYKNWILNMTQTIYNSTHHKLEENVVQLIQFEIDLVQFTHIEDINVHINIKELIKETKINWFHVLHTLFKETTVNVNEIHTIIIKKHYFKHIIKLLRKTHPKIISSYIIWSAIKDLSRHINTDLRNSNFMVDKAILGIEEDLERKHECVETILKYFSHELIPIYTHFYFDNKTVSEVKSIAYNIKKEFINRLENNIWLSDATRAQVVDKIAHLKFEIAFPTFNKASEIELSSNYLLDYLKLKGLQTKTDLELINLDSTFIKWPANPFDVNAYYSILQNAIIIPLGLLSPPFFDLNRPSVLNYGSLGALIGHEISHALDTIGYMSNKHGVVGLWWHLEDVEKFYRKIDCFKKQYEHYGIDGVYTLGENIADNVGLQLSFSAMQRAFMKDLSREIIPDFSYSQLFFIGYGQLWCEDSNDLALKDEHAPVELRVYGSLANSEDFSDSFKCKKTQNKCKLW